MNLNLTMIAALDKASLAKLSERDFQRAVIEYAKQHDWLEYHVDRTATRTKAGGYRPLGPPGFPDLTLVRAGDMVAAELKKQSGSTTPEQRKWLAVLGEVEGIEAVVWKPDSAAEILERLR